MSDDSESSVIAHLEEFDVYAIDGEGIFIADSSDRSWHVVGAGYCENADTKLAEAYREAFRKT